MKGGILIVDFGSQYTQLIARRVRKLNVYSEVHPYNNISNHLLNNLDPCGIILSGGPNSVLDKNSPVLKKNILSIGKPILGICYGLQILTKHLGGEINKSLNREYGHAAIYIKSNSKIIPKNWIKNKKANVWMSHGDNIKKVPKNFSVVAMSNNKIISIIENKKKEYIWITVSSRS
jgi:GMP synthase (glutamine-hydrolysing)